MYEPFMDLFSPDIKTSFDNRVKLDEEDKWSNRVFHNERYKIPNPGDYSFLGYPIEFLAYRVNETKGIESITFFVEDHPEFTDNLLKTLGEPLWISSVTADFMGEDQLSLDFQYQTISWDRGNFSLTLAPPQRLMVGKSGDPVYTLSLFRIWINLLPDR